MTLILPQKTRTIGTDLRRLVGVDQVRDDAPTRTAYAVDASIYRIVPEAVVLAESETDIERVVEYGLSHQVPITPRAAGTNLTGSAIGSGIILDVSRLNRILEVNRDERWARVQPGIVYAELNKRLAREGLMFGPDPSSGDMCKLGGMLSNNSAGPHTLRYGSVKDNVIALRMYLSSSGWLDAKAYALDDSRLRAALAQHPQLDDVLGWIRTSEDLIRSRRPTVSKNSCGYNVFGLVDGLSSGLYDMPKLFVGSEGTLGVISEATIRLVPRPVACTTALIHFRRLDEVGEAVFQLLGLSPSALEVMDGNTINLIGRERHGIPHDAEATLIAEFDQRADDTSAGLRIVEEIESLCRQFSLSSAPVIASDPEKREHLWKARKALYPTLYRYGGGKKPINYVDDVVVPAERIGELIRYLEHYFNGQRVPVAIFGHIGNGNAHIVPLLDLNDQNDYDRMVGSYHAIHDAVLTRFGGSICGEHGDGRIRAEYLPRMFGHELYDLFVQIKRRFDPAGLMNPGIKVSSTSFTEHIDYDRLSKACATCAKCNSVCPVYDVFLSEDMSSRGWFEIVTAKDYRYLDSKRVVDACLNCKSCRTICPADVDVADLILKRRAEHPNRAAGLIFALHARSRLFGRLLKGLAATQAAWDRPTVRRLIEWTTRPLLRRLAPTARIPADLIMPKLARRHLRDRYPELVRAAERCRSSVAYFHGCAANYFEDGVGDAVISLLRRQGIEPALPEQRCSGTPIETYGHVALAKEGARVNLASLDRYDRVVTGCASCTLMLKDYPKLFAGQPEEAAARRLAAKVEHIAQMMADVDASSSSGRRVHHRRKVTYHSSCHLRAAGVIKEPRRVLAGLPGLEFVEMVDADRCAGGAGTFIIKDYETSQKVFERKRRAILESGAEVVATSCPACLIQLKNGLRGRVEVKHIAELVDEASRSTSEPHSA